MNNITKVVTVLTCMAVTLFICAAAFIFGIQYIISTYH